MLAFIQLLGHSNQGHRLWAIYSPLVSAHPQDLGPFSSPLKRWSQPASRCLTEGRVRAVVSTGRSCKRIPSMVKRDFGRHGACSASPRQTSTKWCNVLFCHPPWLPETAACIILPKTYLIPVLLKSQTLVRDVRECSTGSRHSNAIARDCHTTGLPWRKWLDAKLQVGFQGLDFAEGWSIFSSKMRPLDLGEHKLLWEPVFRPLYGVY